MASVSYDDGLYHPPTTTSPLTPSPTAALASTTIIPTPEVSLIPVFPILSPLALAAPITVNLKSSSQVQSSISSIAFASFVSSASPVPIPESSPLVDNKIDTPPNTHSSTRAVATTLVVLFVVFGIVFVAGYLTSRRFRRWKDLHWTREPEPGWSSHDFDEDPSAKAMIKVNSGDPEKATQYDVLGQECGQADPFARSMPRRSIMQSYLDYRRGYTTNPVEQIGDERGWLWGTRGSKKRSNSTTTPGLGSGRYRAKSFKDGSRTSRSSRLLRSLNIPSYYQAPAAERTQYLPSQETLDEKLEERLHEESREELAQSRAEPKNLAGNHRGFYGGFPSTGASYLLTRLKDSIGGRSKLSSLRSSDSRFHHDPARGQWNEVGQWEMADEMETTADQFDDNKMMRSQTPGRTSRKRELSLAEIPLPEVPVLAWDANATSHEATDPMKEPVRRSTRSWTLSSQVAPPLSFTCAPLKTSKDTRKAPASSRANASAPAQTSGSGVFHGQQEQHLNPGPIQVPHQRTFKQPYSLAGAAQTTFGTPDDLPTPRTRSKSRTMSRLPSEPLDSGSYTNLPKVRSHPRRPLPPHPSKGVAARDGTIIHPGGFVGRSPTKKLRKKPPTS